MSRTIFTSAILASLLMPALTRGEREMRFPIERSHSLPTEPLTDSEMKHLDAGEPPPVQSFYWVGGAEGNSFFIHKANQGYFPAKAQLGFVMHYAADFSVESLVSIYDSEAMVIKRDAKGAIIKAGALRDWYFVFKDNDAIVIERYLSNDCATDQHGEMKPLPGAAYWSRNELRQISFDEKNKTRSFHLKAIISPLSVRKSMQLEVVFSQPKGRSHVISREYLGVEDESKVLVSEDSLERIIWPERPGYQQITRIEKHSGDQSKIEHHALEKWQVAKSGERKKIEEENLVPDDEEQSSDDELH